MQRHLCGSSWGRRGGGGHMWLGSPPFPPPPPPPRRGARESAAARGGGGRNTIRRRTERMRPGLVLGPWTGPWSGPELRRVASRRARPVRRALELEPAGAWGVGPDLWARPRVRPGRNGHGSCGDVAGWDSPGPMLISDVSGASLLSISVLATKPRIAEDRFLIKIQKLLLFN